MGKMKEVYTAEIESMIDDVIRKFGFEAKETLHFCYTLENESNIAKIRGEHLCLMLK